MSHESDRETTAAVPPSLLDQHEVIGVHGGVAVPTLDVRALDVPALDDGGRAGSTITAGMYTPLAERRLGGGEGLLYAIDPLVTATAAIEGRGARAPGGHLHWYRHLGHADGGYRWQGPKIVGNGWAGLRHVFSGGDGVVYVVDRITQSVVPTAGPSIPHVGGQLHWYRHLGRADGSFRWEDARVVGHGWGAYAHVFSGGDGILYAVEVAEHGGRLLWFRHLGRADGSARWEGPNVVGRGWSGFRHVFSGGDGIIYAVEPATTGASEILGQGTAPRAGRLLWYRHLGREDGSFRWDGGKPVGDGWGALEHVFAGDDGVIYAIDPVREATVPLVGRASPRSGGSLYWYRHLGRVDGTARWQGPRKVGDGWGGLEHVFAGGDGAAAGQEALHPERLCDFLDPAGTPTVGIQAYGLKNGHKRSSQLRYSVTGTVTGVNNLPQLVTTAFNLWSAATVPAPGLPPMLTATLVTNGPVDVAVGVGPTTNAGNSGETAPDGASITISSTFAFTARNPVVAGTCSLLATIIHEVGHALGLLHATSPASVLNPSNCTTETLAPDDIAAVRALYGWPAQRPIPGVGTDESPALCECNGSLVMAWKGIGESDLWVSRSSDGVSWTPQARVFGAASTDGPALAWDGSMLWMAFRGIAGDDALYWTTCTDTSPNFAQGFSQVRPIDGTGSTNGPALAVFNGTPILAWRGVEGDDALYYTTFVNGNWAGQKPIGGVGSRDRPSLCIDFNGLPRMVWRGIEGDDALYTSALVGRFWQPQQLLQWVIAGNGPQGTVALGTAGSDLGPSIATAPAGARSFTAGGGAVGNVFAVWRGVPGDQGIYFTQGAPGTLGQPPVEWSSQAAIEGIGSSHRPAIAIRAGRIHLVWKGSLDDTTIWTTAL